MGRVYAGRLAGGCDVAVKVMGEGGRVECFEREKALLRRIDSPFVPRVFDAGTDDMLVMERALGVELCELLELRGCLTFVETCRVLDQLADALEDVHAAGIVHGDVKTSNVLVDECGGEVHVTLVDFGVARDMHGDHVLDVDSLPSGTPTAMAPEQMTAPHAPSVGWDVWALASLAYECLTGRTPHPGRTLAAVWRSATDGSRPAASSLRANLPIAVDAVFERAFARQARYRYPTARTFVDALVSALQLDTVAAATFDARPAQSEARLKMVPRTRRDLTAPTRVRAVA